MARSVTAALVSLGLALGAVAPAAARTAPPAKTAVATQASGASSSSASSATRPATTTFYGDTGLWFVPTAEVLSKGAWSVSGYRAGFNAVPGFTNVSDIAGTFGVGLGGRVELFGSVVADSRIDRDIRPLFGPGTVGGIVARYPFVTTGFTGNHLGDVYVGAKVNLLSQERQNPVAFALRGIVKLPTGDKTVGLSTGKTDVLLDAILSKEVAEKVELSAFGGVDLTGTPAGFSSYTKFAQWGVGLGYPSRTPFRVIAEAHGDLPFNSTVTLSAPLVASDGSLSPLSATVDKMTTTTVGLVWQAKNGFFVGGGINWNFPTADRASYTTDETLGVARDFVDYQFRIGFHPGVGVYVPPVPPPPPPPPPPANQPPTVQATCDPCTVNVGQTATVTAVGHDPDGDTLTYQWTAPAGTLADATASTTKWTAPMDAGPVPITVTVNDGKGGTASDTVTIQVTKPPVKVYTFEDVDFGFDQYSLRQAGLRILDEVVKAMQEDPTLHLQIQGYTDNIGTPEYNLALGDRRAKAVQNYLVSRGIDASRLGTISFGEENPKYSNAREETRRLNRRAALVVRLVH
ncbi:MAG: OmpA family protein [Acidobacteriota bacterium]|nr:OmpA family protein [Acidobacteriota bacterium]